jgi:RNA polymerase sigma-70 factor (ECF subfamily)
MDIEIFDGLFESHWQTVYASAFKRLANTAKATEITQEAFFQLWQKRDQVSSEDVLSFLLTVVQKEILKLMKNECLHIVQPSVELFKQTDFPFAN